jgi:hypothetical protein
MLILPWFSFFFMKKEEIKYYMPVGIFSGLTSAIISEAGASFGFWINQETTYPLSQIMPFDIGLNIVLTMWIVKYTFRRFGVYMLVNLILDIGFNFYLFNVFFPNRDILHLVGISPLQSLSITLTHAVVIYGYQLWQEDALVFPGKNRSSIRMLKPAAAKPLRDENGRKKE